VPFQTGKPNFSVNASKKNVVFVERYRNGSFSEQSVLIKVKPKFVKLIRSIFFSSEALLLIKHGR
jgi:hypothetical protein